MQSVKTASRQRFYTTTFVLLGIVGLGIVFRWSGIHEGFWRDEASTYFDVAPSSIWAAIRRIATSELNPPLYFLLVREWIRLFGASAPAFKLFSVCCGSVAIVGAAWLGHVIGGRRTALLSAAFVAFFAPANVLCARCTAIRVGRRQ